MAEAVIAVSLLAIGLAGVFATGSQVMRILGHAREIVAARQLLDGRMDRIRSAKYEEITSPTFLTGVLLAPNAAGDAVTSESTRAIYNLVETVTVHALGERLFTNAAARTAAVPLRAGETGSQLDTPAPAAPMAFAATGLMAGNWSLSAAPPSLQAQRTGTGNAAAVSLLINNNLQTHPQVRVDVQIDWTDSNGRRHTEMSSTIIAKLLLPK